MELSSEVVEGLQLTGDVLKLNDATFEKVVRRAVDSACTSTSKVDSGQGDDQLYFQKANRPLVKVAFYAMVTLFVEAAKHGIDAAVLQSLLEDHHFSNERIATVTKLYQERKSSIESQLKRISFNLPHIVDVDWRLDYCIKSDVVEKIDEPVYLVTLTTENGDGNSDQVEPITFNCTVDQLQDLVVKLKDAVKCLERISQK